MAKKKKSKLVPESKYIELSFRGSEGPELEDTRTFKREKFSSWRRAANRLAQETINKATTYK